MVAAAAWPAESAVVGPRWRRADLDRPCCRAFFAVPRPLRDSCQPGGLVFRAPDRAGTGDRCPGGAPPVSDGVLDTGGELDDGRRHGRSRGGDLCDGAVGRATLGARARAHAIRAETRRAPADLLLL